MNPQIPSPPDLLEQAHLAFLQGNLDLARSLLDRLVIAEPNNLPAQNLRATVIGKQAALMEMARLKSGSSPDVLSQTQTGSIWTRPVSDPVSSLLNSQTAGKWPKPILLIVCLLAGVVFILIPSGHGHYVHSHYWKMDIAFGIAVGLGLFIWMVRKK